MAILNSGANWGFPLCEYHLWRWNSQVSLPFVLVLILEIWRSRVSPPLMSLVVLEHLILHLALLRCLLDSLMLASSFITCCFTDPGLAVAGSSMLWSCESSADSCANLFSALLLSNDGHEADECTFVMNSNSSFSCALELGKLGHSGCTLPATVHSWKFAPLGFTPR